MNDYERLGELIGMRAQCVKDDIDADMIPILIVLNEKGYYTMGCCQGHNSTENRRTDLFISFLERYDFEGQLPPILIDKNEKPPKESYGELWLSKRYSGFNHKSRINYCTSKTDDINKKERERKEIIDLIYNWACGLKPFEREV